MSATEQQLKVAELFRAARDRSIDQDNLQRHAKRRALHATRRLDFQSGALRNIPGRLKNQDLCDPSSTDADTGILSCGEDRMCQTSLESKLGGVCVRKNRSAGFADILGSIRSNSRLIHYNTIFSNIVECDPAAIDVGILACEEGQFCRKDEAYELGGVCVATSANSRHLYTVELCNPASQLFSSTCDCTGFDPTTGAGFITCPYPGVPSAIYNYPGCEDITTSSSVIYTFQGSILASYGLCYDFTTTYNQQSCFQLDLLGQCSVQLNGQTCSSCTMTGDTYFVDCSNVEGGGVGSSALDFVPILATCYSPSTGNSTGTYNCFTLCSEGDYIADANQDITVTVQGVGVFTCGDLAVAEALGTISDTECSAFITAAQSACCVYQCDLCGQGASIPSENFDIPVTIPVTGYDDYTCSSFFYAAYVNFSIPEGTCAQIGGLIQQTCCGSIASDCSICGGELTYPDAVYTIEGETLTCDLMQSMLNSTECVALSPLLSPVCCGVSSMSPTTTPMVATPSSVPQQQPSLAPTSQGGSEQVPTDTSIPQDGATALFSIKTVASVVGVVTASILLVMSS